MMSIMKNDQSLINDDRKIRISRFLALCGVSSRRKCEDYVANGSVRVNGKVIKNLSFKVSKNDIVELNEKVIKHQNKRTVMLNKPVGYLSTARDDFGRKTVMDLVKDKDYRLFPVGRLDYNSRGLMILTNDGDLAYQVTHPKFKIPKTYEVKINNKISPDDINIIKKGIKVEGRAIIPIEIKIIHQHLKTTTIRIKIVEGRKRIIRRTFKKIGYNVIDLKRTHIGGLGLRDLKEGECRDISNIELKKIQASN